VPQSGALLANSWWLLALLSGVFLLAAAVYPLRRMRNLDALALAAFVANVVLVNASLLAASVVVSAMLLAYLMGRCLYVAMRPRRHSELAQVPLLEKLTPAWEDARRLRLLRVAALALLVAFLLITLTSNGETDVAAASLSGATDLLHGQLPYGHIIPGVLHGDTYPLLNYVLYLPGALVHPVSEEWSDLSGGLLVAAAAALACALALAKLARRLAPDRPLAGTRAALMWFAFPPVLLAASGGANDLVLAACLAWMLVLAESALLSLLMLALAVWTKLAPIVLLPLWLARPERRRPRVLVPAIALSLAPLVALLAMGGGGAPATMVSDIAFQFQRGSFYAPWYTFSLQWLQPLAQAAVVTALATLLVRAHCEAELLNDPVRCAGACGALLLGLQLSANYWTWSYLPWAFPFIAVALLMDHARLRSAREPARRAWVPVRVRVLSASGARASLSRS